MANDMCVSEITMIILSSSAFMCILLIEHVFISLCMIVCPDVQLCSVCLLFSPFLLLEKVTAVEAEPAHVPALQFPNVDSRRSLLCCSLVSGVIRNRLQQCGASFMDSHRLGNHT